MKKLIEKIRQIYTRSRTCRYCGYSGGGWKDDDECPSCGEVN